MASRELQIPMRLTANPYVAPLITFPWDGAARSSSLNPRLSVAESSAQSVTRQEKQRQEQQLASQEASSPHSLLPQGPGSRILDLETLTGWALA